MPEISEAQEFQRWNIIYPNYIDATKTIPQGRRIPKEVAVDNPHLEEIGEALRFLGLRAMPEAKAYPRDWLTPGRVRVELKRADGSDAHPEIKTKKQLMVRMAETIAKLKSRDGGKAPPAVLDELMKQAKEFGNPAQASASSKKEEKKNKKGKKK